ncbi:particle associated protein [Yersinia phage fHe-Yen8-01]|nr:particle associated protein [Yersinia phage fHe-Yen8-01]
MSLNSLNSPTKLQTALELADASMRLAGVLSNYSGPAAALLEKLLDLLSDNARTMIIEAKPAAVDASSSMASCNAHAVGVCEETAAPALSIDDMFQHFLAYSGNWRFAPEISDQLKAAFSDGFDAGQNTPAPVRVMKVDATQSIKFCHNEIMSFNGVLFTPLLNERYLLDSVDSVTFIFPADLNMVICVITAEYISSTGTTAFVSSDGFDQLKGMERAFENAFSYLKQRTPNKSNS